MITFETPNGKKIQTKKDQKTAQIRVEFASGGELPESLTGVFTTEREATFAILRYLSSLGDKKERKSNQEN